MDACLARQGPGQTDCVLVLWVPSIRPMALGNQRGAHSPHYRAAIQGGLFAKPKSCPMNNIRTQSKQAEGKRYSIAIRTGGQPDKPSAASLTRRSFLRKGVAAGAGTLAAGLMVNKAKAGGLTSGDAALLRFPAALEILEADFWIQYNELGGVQGSEVSGGTGNP